jgi:hypothetical protein
MAILIFGRDGLHDEGWKVICVIDGDSWTLGCVADNGLKAGRHDASSLHAFARLL